MKRLLSILLTAFLITNCSEPKQPEVPTLCVSIPPLRPLIKEIVGDDFQIDVLVPPGLSPETFEPTPKQISGLNDARMIFYTGLIDFERSLISKNNDPVKIVDLSQDIRPIAGDCAHDGHAHGVDPHIWTSPSELKIMSTNAYQALSRLFPDSAKYLDNYDALYEKLDRLDREVADRIERSGVRSFIVYHPALSYFARAYGLEQIAIEDEGKEPSAKRLSRIIDKARDERIERIFYQVQFPVSAVETISRDIGGQSIGIDPMREDVFDNILEITDLITSQ